MAGRTNVVGHTASVLPAHVTTTDAVAERIEGKPEKFSGVAPLWATAREHRSTPCHHDANGPSVEWLELQDLGL